MPDKIEQGYTAVDHKKPGKPVVTVFQHGQQQQQGAKGHAAENKRGRVFIGIQERKHCYSAVPLAGPGKRISIKINGAQQYKKQQQAAARRQQYFFSMKRRRTCCK